MQIVADWNEGTQPPDVLMYKRQRTAPWEPEPQEEPIDLVAHCGRYWLYRFPVVPRGRHGEDHFKPNQR